MPTLATALLQGLKDHGAREIFGIPGDFVLPLYKAIEESGILPHYQLSHEPAVGFAADAAARYHVGLGVAVVTYGAGAFNLVNAIAGAYAERSPVVVIAGAPRVRVGDRTRRLEAEGTVTIPKGVWHRIENPGRAPVVIIEVQHGAYLGEDDIVRRADDYGRVDAAASPRSGPRNT